MRRSKSFALLFLWVVVALAVQSCGRAGLKAGASAGDTVRFKYAEHITVVRHDGYTVVALANPWKKNQELHRYILVARKDSVRAGRLPEGTVVYTPVERCVVFTSPHCWLLNTLGAGRTLKGVCDLAYINIPYVHEAVRRGTVADCGNSMSPSAERIASISPQAIFVSPFEGGSYGQVANLGAPIIECADYMETSALGRAEWMRFYGMLVGKEHEADSLFNVVEGNYGKLREAARKSHVRPRVITERVVSGVWYCPGGKSSMGRLIADAGGKYVFADNAHCGSLTLSPEMVVDKAANADCWLFVGSGAAPMSRAQLQMEYSGYKLIKAFRDGHIYECLPSIKVPYFEEMSFRPDFLMADFVKIFHPDIALNGETRYYNAL